jgi:hypothetical protein
MKRSNFCRTISFIFCWVILPGVLFAQNLNCTIVIPDAPFTAAGLATPYQLKATDPNDGNGPCSETNANSSAFVQAAIFDPATAQISIYNPLVIDAGSSPAVDPVVPNVPEHAIVALWFGFNGNNLTQQGARPRVLKESACVNGMASVFGQYSYCNAPAFFRAANRAIHVGKLTVPKLGIANDNRRCPTVRDFSVVDQDQSDNLPVTYLISAGGLMAQNTQENMATLSGATVLGNPSDNGLLDRFIDPAIACTPWKVSDLADPGQQVPGLALNELQARSQQRWPMALIPAGDPMTLDADGGSDLAKTNAYRRGVDQPEARGLWQADTARYCRNMLRIAPARLLEDQIQLTAGPSPVATSADSLFTFLAQRFIASYNILGCGDLVHIVDPVSVTTSVSGVATGAKIDLSLYGECKRRLAPYERQDNDANQADEKAAASLE